MDILTLYNLKVFERLGAPLMNSVLRHAHKKGAKISAQDANEIAMLLKTTLSVSQELAPKFKADSVQEADAIRLALSCYASPMVAENYAKTGNDLDEQDIKKIQEIFDTVLGFSKNFTEAKDAANKRLRLADPDPLATSERLVFDDDQMVLQTMQAMLPVAIRMAEYDFGHPRKELLDEVSKKLQSRAKLLAKSLFGKDMDKSDQKLAELGVLRSIAHIYSSCHMAQKRRFEDMEDNIENKEDEKLLEKLKNKDGGYKLDDLWQMFEMRTGLMVTLVNSIVSSPAEEEETESPKASKPKKEPKTAAKKETKKTATDNSNPMSFFTKKNDDGANEAEKTSQATEKDKEEIDLPPLNEEKKEEALETSPETSNDDEDQGDGDSGNPMSFFAKKKTG